MITIVVTSPRTPAGSLRREAWAALSHADAVLAPRDDAAARAVRDAGIPVDVVENIAGAARRGIRLHHELHGPYPGAPVEARLALLVCAGRDDVDGLREALTADETQLETVLPSPDLPGARLLDAVAVMDRLRTGCPWDREQTHATLAKYLVEEAYEALEAIDSGDAEHLREELGDVLLQVLFHARVAQDGPRPFGIDDVAAGYVEKMTRRHPHVFGDVSAADAGAVEENWETLKAAEKAERTHVLDGIPPMPPLERADKYLTRLDRAGHLGAARALAAGPAVSEHERIGQELLAAVLSAREAGVDAAAALRDTLTRLRNSI